MLHTTLDPKAPKTHKRNRTDVDLPDHIRLFAVNAFHNHSLKVAQSMDKTEQALHCTSHYGAVEL